LNTNHIIGISKDDFTLTDEFVIGYRVYRTVVTNNPVVIGNDNTININDIKNKLFFVGDFYKNDMVLSGNNYIFYKDGVLFEHKIKLTTSEDDALALLGKLYSETGRKDFEWAVNDLFKGTLNLFDTITGTPYEAKGYLNTYPFLGVNQSIGDQYVQLFYQEVTTDYLLKPTCGAYIDNRLFINNTNDTLLYMSEVDNTDGIRADLAYQLSDVTDSNPITAIIGVHKNIFIFTASSIDALRPSSNPDAPYIVQNISHTRGVKHWSSICEVDSMIYFIYDNSIWAMNSQGIMKEVGANIADQLKEATDTIKLTRGEGGSVNIMFRTSAISTSPISDYNFKHLVFYPIKQYMTEVIGLRDKFTFDGTQDDGGYYTGELSAEQEDYVIVSGAYNELTDSFYGVTKYGELVVRDKYCDYTNNSLVDTVDIWGFNARWYNVGGLTPSYGVFSEFEKPLFFNTSAILNTIILVGSGIWFCSLSTDNRAYTTVKRHTLGNIDTGILFNSQGKLHKFKARNEEEADIDIQNVSFKVVAQNKVTLANTPSGGVNG
jgi:hypothetical protein